MPPRLRATQGPELCREASATCRGSSSSSSNIRTASPHLARTIAGSSMAAYPCHPTLPTLPTLPPCQPTHVVLHLSVTRFLLLPIHLFPLLPLIFSLLLLLSRTLLLLLPAPLLPLSFLPPRPQPSRLPCIQAASLETALQPAAPGTRPRLLPRPLLSSPRPTLRVGLEGTSRAPPSMPSLSTAPAALLKLARAFSSVCARYECGVCVCVTVKFE